VALRGETITGGTTQSLTASFQDDAVLYLWKRM
jgi:hypothetical protein